MPQITPQATTSPFQQQTFGNSPEYRKPSWLSLDEWKKFLIRWEDANGWLYCQSTEDRLQQNEFSVDHIVSRHEWNKLVKSGELTGSPDIATNLQPMRRDKNSAKGILPDTYWTRKFFFDRPINRDLLRVSQSDYTYDVILNNAKHFASSYDLINGKLFTFVQIVGAGKTLGMLSAAMGYNAAANLISPGLTRVDRILILAKDKTLRGQIAHEIRNEPYEFGIIDKRPKVLEVKRGETMVSNAYQHNDIVVSCGHQLWNKSNGSLSDSELQKILARYPLIIFDEVHWANAQAARVAEAATHSLCLGFTASPIRGDGSVIERSMVRCSCYGYRDAVRNDNSMASLGETIEIGRDDVEFNDIIHEVNTEEYRRLGEEEWKTFEPGTGDSDIIADSLKAVFSVACEVVRKLDELDHLPLDDMTLSEHRRNYKKDVIEVGHRFCPHAIIRVSDRETAMNVTQFLNKMFKLKPNKYPKRKGWRAEYAISGGAGENRSLDANHPWFYSNKNNGKVNSKVARILVVVDMATEGVNNKLAKVIGFAHRVQSTKGVVQSVGRLIRSPHKVEADKHIVPPSQLDRINIITHETYNNGARLREALRFLGNMHDATSSIKSLDEYFEDLDGGRDDIEGRTLSESLTYFEQVNISARVGDDLMVGRNTSIQSLQEALGARTAQKRRMIRDLAERVINQQDNQIEKLKRKMCIKSDPGKIQIVEDERLDFSRTPEQLDEWAMLNSDISHVMNFKGMVPEEDYYKALAGVYKAVGESHHVTDTESVETVAGIIDSMTEEMLVHIPCVSRCNPDLVKSFLLSAIQRMLSTEDPLDEESDLNNIHVLHALRRDRNRKNIWGNVIFCLAEAGELEQICQAMRIEELTRTKEVLRAN